MHVAVHEVVIAGGGPTGLMLAGELALAGIDVAIVERRETQEVTGARAGGLHARTIEVLDQRGIADRFLAEGQAVQAAGFAWFPLDISDFPSRHNYVLALTQRHIERILAQWVEERGVPILRGQEVTGLTQDASGVEVELASGETLRAGYLVGCDGGRSTVRRAAGIDFPGWDATVSHLIAEVQVTEEPAWGLRRDEHGIHSLGRAEDGTTVRVLVTERNPGRFGEPTLDDLAGALVEIYGTDFGIHNPAWISRFTDMARQAATYRKGRVLLAGDAAHIHYPTGGQGLNTGVQDAVNLGWKLAQVVREVSPGDLLETYHAERHPVGASVLHNTLAQVALLRTDARTNALRHIAGDLLAMDEPRRKLGGMISGLDIRYDLGEGHPLLGRRMPDLDLVTADGPVRAYRLLHEAWPVLLEFGGPHDTGISPWPERVKRVHATHSGAWELPVVGEVAAPTAVLVRPDGHVAWVGEGSDSGLREAITTWFGTP